MDRRNDLLSYPLRKLGPYLLEGMDKKQKSRTQLSAMALMAMAAAPTFFGNVVLPVNLISMGLKPQPINLGLSHYRHHFHVASRAHWMEPVFDILHKASPAYNAGAKIGGKVGGRVASRLIPGVGYGLLAYDAYDLAVNRSLWGFDL